MFSVGGVLVCPYSIVICYIASVVMAIGIVSFYPVIDALFLSYMATFWSVFVTCGVGLHNGWPKKTLLIRLVCLLLVGQALLIVRAFNVKNWFSIAYCVLNLFADTAIQIFAAVEHCRKYLLLVCLSCTFLRLGLVGICALLGQDFHSDVVS